MNIPLRNLAILTLLALSVTAQTWNSQLLPSVNGKFTAKTVHFAGRTWKLDDFSYVGYHLGQDSLGSVPCHKTVHISGHGDISAEVQKAIDTVGIAGGGIVTIPNGTYSMSTAVSIPYDNVSIVGQDSAKTIIRIPANYNSQEASTMAESVFTFGRKLNTSNRGWTDKGSVVATVTSPIARGALAATVNNTSQVNAGDWVIVQQYFWQTLVDRNSQDPDKWPANSTAGHSIFSFSYLRQVVTKTANKITFDAPIPITLDPANNPLQIRLANGNMHQNSGIARLTIEFAANTDPRTKRPHGTAVYFEGVHDAWAYDVHVVNFPRNGFYADFSARITFLECSVNGAQDKGGLGYGYGFLESGAQNILFRRCHGQNTRHNFISSRSLTSMIVYSRCISESATQPDDTHYAFEQALLWDRHTQKNGEALTAFNRGDESGGAYETLASGLVWNFTGDGVAGSLPHGGAIYLKPSPEGSAIVIGVTGQDKVFDNSLGNTASPFVPGDLIQPKAGLQVGTGAGALGNVLYEGLDRSGLQPESLYESQLLNRIGTAPPAFVGNCILD